MKKFFLNIKDEEILRLYHQFNKFKQFPKSIKQLNYLFKKKTILYSHVIEKMNL